jgi:hypothetical protein
VAPCDQDVRTVASAIKRESAHTEANLHVDLDVSVGHRSDALFGALSNGSSQPGKNELVVEMKSVPVKAAHESLRLEIGRNPQGRT